MDVDKMPIGFSAAGSYDIAENCRYRQFIDETGLYCGQIKEQSEYLLFTHRRKHIIENTLYRRKSKTAVYPALF